MKKLLVLTLAVCLIIGFFFLTYFPPTNQSSEKLNVDNVTSIKQHEELSQELILTLLNPYVNAEIEKYYKILLTENPFCPPYVTNILSISKPNSNNAYEYLATIEAKPYVGPHLNVGLDHLTLRILLNGDVTIEKYEHLNTTDLPPNWEHIMIPRQ